jgi:L-methionine (R)-S-oxide reductase
MMSVFEVVHTTFHSDAERYEALHQQVSGLIHDEGDPIANMANVASLVYHTLPDLNWVGFYRFLPERDELVLGPFHGLPACIRIRTGHGVCGTAVASRATVRVEDVHQFPGHIACDAASQSELVIPMMQSGRVLGVLDLDSPKRARFTEADQEQLERVVAALVKGCEWT